LIYLFLYPKCIFSLKAIMASSDQSSLTDFSDETLETDCVADKFPPMNSRFARLMAQTNLPPKQRPYHHMGAMCSMSGCKNPVISDSSRSSGTYSNCPHCISRDIRDPKCACGWCTSCKRHIFGH